MNLVTNCHIQTTTSPLTNNISRTINSVTLIIYSFQIGDFLCVFQSPLTLANREILFAE